MLKKSFVAIAAILLVASLVSAQVPQLINYQGVLIDPATGHSVPDDIYSIIFSIYDVPSGGSGIWSLSLSVSGWGICADEEGHFFEMIFRRALRLHALSC